MSLSPNTTSSDVDIDAELAQLASISSPALLLERIARLAHAGISTAQLAAARHCRPYEIRHLLRLDRRLTAKSRQLLAREQITLGHARALATWSATEQDALAGECLARRWSVRELERQRRARRDGMSTQERTAQFSRLADQVAEQTGYPCEFITHPKNAKGGQLALTFSDYEELDGILRRLRIRLEDDD